MPEKIILHVDLNNFFASVEQVLNPDLKGKPIAVCGNPDKRHGIVLAKSMPAKLLGVQTAEPIWQALKKCPNLILVSPHYSEYVKYSKMVKEIYIKYTSQVESFGLDECWLDVTGSTKLFGNGEEIAEKIRKEVKELTNGLTVSIGVSFTKVFAKLGSDLKKPDAISIINKNNYKDVAWPLDVRELLYVGQATERRLHQLNIYTIGDLAKSSLELLVKNFGKLGATLYESANGIEQDDVKCYTDRHMPESVGNGTTTEQDVTNRTDAKAVIYALSEMIGFRLRGYNAICSGVSISLRDNTLKTVSKQGKLAIPTNAAEGIALKAVALLDECYDFKKQAPLRTITVCAFNLNVAGDYVQTTLLGNANEKKENLDKVIDKLRGKFGYNVLQRAININTIFTCDSKEAEEDFIPFSKR